MFVPLDLGHASWLTCSKRMTVLQIRRGSRDKLGLISINLHKTVLMRGHNICFHYRDQTWFFMH